MAKRRKRIDYDDTPRGDPPELPPPENVPRRPRRSIFEVIPWPTWIVLGAVGVVLLSDWGRGLVGLAPRGETVIDLGQGNAQSTKAPMLGTVPPPNPNAPPPVAQTPTSVDHLAAAVTRSIPLFEDSEQGKSLPLGVDALVIYIMKAKPRISDFLGLKETSVAAAIGNPDKARGRTVCVTGVIDEMIEGTITKPIAHGGLLTVDLDPVRFVVVGATGTITKRDKARVCGTFVGRHHFTSNAGTKEIAALIVGIFDLPENR